MESRNEEFNANSLCWCVKHFEDDRTDGLLNTGACVCTPHFVRNTIFLCGFKESRFPFHCMVGPHWMVMTATSLTIIIPSLLFLIFICENISRYMTIADGILVLIVVVSHWITAFTDPGTIYCRDINLYDAPPRQEMVTVDNTFLQASGTLDAETGTQSASTDTGNKGTSLLQTTPPVRMECNICGIARPDTARHCYSCNTCVDHMDHHCPFTGKCVGKKNYYTFQIFVQLVGLHTYFVIGTTLYYVIAKVIIPTV